MSSGIAIDVAGFDDLKKKIIALGDPKDKKKELLLLLAQIAKPTVDAAKLLVPISERPHLSSGARSRKIIQPRSLQRSIGTITGKKGAAVENPMVYVGTRAKGSFEGWYGNFVHENTNIYRNATSYTVTKGKKKSRTRNVLARARNKSGGNNVQGVKQGNPFLKKAYAQTGGQVTADAERKIAAFIQRRINKLGS